MRSRRAGSCHNGVRRVPDQNKESSQRYGTRKRMEPILIAHLSDLHFGEGDSNAVWDALVTYINDTLKPHLVLVTGDVVNTPDAALFRRAKEQLDRLRPRSTPEDRYRLCPGNHDRFWLGNSAGKPGFWTRMLGGNDEARNLTRPAHGELENFFKGGLVLTPEFPFDVTLPSGTDQQKGGNSWKLRILGGDSCEEDTYFAQGLLNTKAISDLRATAFGDRHRHVELRNGSQHASRFPCEPRAARSRTSPAGFPIQDLRCGARGSRSGRYGIIDGHTDAQRLVHEACPLQRGGAA